MTDLKVLFSKYASNALLRISQSTGSEMLVCCVVGASVFDHYTSYTYNAQRTSIKHTTSP